MAELCSAKGPLTIVTFSLGGCSIGTEPSCWANLANSLVVLVLVVASKVRAVNLLGKVKFGMGASVGCYTLRACKDSFWRVVSSGAVLRLTSLDVVSVSAIVATWADELDIDIDWGVVASGNCRGCFLSKSAYLVFSTSDARAT